MYKNQIGEELELSDRVVCGLSRLLTFKSTDSYSNMSRYDHINIISAISYCKRGLFREPIFDHSNDFCFLLWTNTAG